MSRQGRGLTPEEIAIWARVAQTVQPLKDRKVQPRHGEEDPRAAAVEGEVAPAAASPPSARKPVPLHQPAAGLPPRTGGERRVLDRHGLDASWDRKLARGVVQPDVTLDLHGATLDAAHARLEQALTQALAQGARVMLLITGRSRVSEDHSGRAGRRGVIRAKFADWLMAGPHAGRIAAIRPAHPRHGGAGAVYLVLRKPR